MDISDYRGLADINPSYLTIDKQLEFIPMNGTYAVPYVANAAGVLYNRGMFQENGWEIPETWEEFKALCDTIQAAGIQPLYFGFKDTWNCLAPWNAIAVDLACLLYTSIYKTYLPVYNGSVREALYIENRNPAGRWWEE